MERVVLSGRDGHTYVQEISGVGAVVDGKYPAVMESKNTMIVNISGLVDDKWTGNHIVRDGKKVGEVGYDYLMDSWIVVDPWNEVMFRSTSFKELIDFCRLMGEVQFAW